MEDRITITDSAASKLRRIMEGGKQDFGLRISGSFSACCGLTYSLDLEEKPGEGDVVKESNGIKLFINEFAIYLVDGVEIDYLESEGFVVKASTSG